MWNMPLKSRTEPDELKILRFVNARMELTEKEKRYYLHKDKGYEGEVKFDTFTEKLEDGRVVLNDLLLEVNNTKFQIDTTLIEQEIIKLFEVKNYEGDYLYKNENFYFISDKENLIQNPLDQLKRCKTLLQQLLQKLGYNFYIEGWVIFINPEFTLYEAPRDKPIILPTQLNQFMKNLNSKPSRVNGKHIKLAEKLIALHQVDSPYERLRHYEYNHLEKGIVCCKCCSLNVSTEGKKIVCKKCGHHESLDSAILRCVEEHKLLFPDKKITTSGIYEWCNRIASKKVIQKNLKEHYRPVGYRKGIYYE
jgi:hypothetical protein